MVVGLKTPKIKIGNFKEFLTSRELIVVAGAILVTPLLLGVITSIVSRFPVLRDNIALGLAIGAFVLFILASMFGGMIRALVLGISAGVLITAIQTTSFGQSVLGRLGGGS